MQQIRPFDPKFHLGQEVTELTKREDGRFLLRTAAGTTFNTGAVVIAAASAHSSRGASACLARKSFEGDHIRYRVRDAHLLHGKRLVVFGGGDSALDWAIELAPKAASLALVHRRPDFRGAPASVLKMRELIEAGRIRHVEGIAHALNVDNGTLLGVMVKGLDGSMVSLDSDHMLVFFGLHPKLGPIAEWGLELEKKALKVDTEKFQTSVPGIYAVGDINTYPGKKKLILSGFTRRRWRHSPFSIISIRREAVPAIHDDEPDHAETARRH